MAGLIALVQTDIKRMVAYSSISHMGFIVLGIFALGNEGSQGAVAGLRSELAWFESRPLFGKRVLVTGADFSGNLDLFVSLEEWVGAYLIDSFD